MKLRYIEIDPDVIAELPDWSRLQIERENERTLKDLGITRQANESYLLAWVRTVLAENGCEDNPENRQRLIEAIRQDWKEQLFVWVLGGDERKAFGVDDSPAFQEHLVRHHAARSLAPGCFYDHDDPRYWDYQTPPGQNRGTEQRAPHSRIAQSVLGFFVVAVGAWAASGLMAPGGWRPMDFFVLLLWTGLIAAGAALILGFVAVIAGKSGHHLRQLGLWVAVPTALAAIGLHLNASRKLEADVAQREHWVVQPRVEKQSVEEVGYIQQIKRVDNLWEHGRNIVWFVKIPATNKLYSCTWESGFAAFAKDDAVRLIHKKSDIDDGDYSGFLVGFHGDQVGRSAGVWALDVDDLQMLDLNER